MSSINRDKIRRLILKEFKMMGMADLGHGGMKPMGMTSHLEPEIETIQEPTKISMSHSSMGGVSGEDCCEAILALIECCSCESTKQKIRAVCEDIIDEKSNSYHSG